MMANTREMMRVQEKRADREDRSLEKTGDTLCYVFRRIQLIVNHILKQTNSTIHRRAAYTGDFQVVVTAAESP